MSKLVIVAICMALLSLAFSAACAGAAVTPEAPPAPTATAPAAPTPAPLVGAIKLDISVGTPPSEGWRWVVAEIITGDGELTEPLNPGHEFFWEFFVVRGSTEVTTPEGTKVASAGQGIMVSAKQQHSHRHLPQSKVLTFDVRSANDNPDRFHGGNRLFLSDKLSLRSSSDHKLRVQEFSLTPGQRLPETTFAEPNFVYVIDGTLNSGTTAVETGKASSLPLNVKLVLSNAGQAPLRFLLVDVRP